jgi:hypothetical protein
MVNAEELLAGVQPQLDAFLKPDEARRAANVLKAALKYFAADAYATLERVRERAHADAIDAAERLDTSLEESRALRREWEREVRQQRDTFADEKNWLQARLSHAQRQVTRLEALAAASAAAAKADARAAAAAADAERKRTDAERAAERLHLRRQARAHAATLAVQMLDRERNASARLEAVCAELGPLEQRVAACESERASLLSDLLAARDDRTRMAIAAKEAGSHQQARAEADLRGLSQQKDGLITSLTLEVERLRSGTQRVLKAKDTGLEAALEQLFFESLKRPAIMGVQGASIPPVPPTTARRGVTSHPASPRASLGRRPPQSARTSRPRAEPWRPHRLNISEPWRAGRWE